MNANQNLKILRLTGFIHREKKSYFHGIWALLRQDQGHLNCPGRPP